MLDPSLEDKALFPGDVSTPFQDKILQCLLCMKMTQEFPGTAMAGHALKSVTKSHENLKEVNSSRIRRRPVQEV
ncbi:MAG: hypothetical protein WBA22_08510 [Candidatus Methanofastidiosia archaeon]